MAEEGFKLPASSYEEVTKIIMGYGKTRGPVPPSEISSLTGQNADNISKNNPFLVSVGIVEGGKKKVITEVGRSLARALEHEMPDEIIKNWRHIVLSNDFLQKILSAIKIRRGMDASTLQAHVAYSAGQPKSPRVMAGAKAIIDILRAAGLVIEDDGKYTIAPEGDMAAGEETTSALTPYVVHPDADYQPVIQAERIIKPPVYGSGAGISIQIQIQCSVNEIDGLGVKLRQLLNDLSSGGARESDDDEQLGLDEREESSGSIISVTTPSSDDETPQDFQLTEPGE